MEKKMLSLEVTDELKEALRIRAFKENVSISKLIRGILEANLTTELLSIKKGQNNGPKK